MSHLLLFVQPAPHILNIIETIDDSYTALSTSSLEEACTLMTADCSLLFLPYDAIRNDPNRLQELPNSESLVVLHASSAELEQALYTLNTLSLYRIITDAVSEDELQAIVEEGSLLYDRNRELGQLRSDVLKLARQDRLTGCCNRNYGAEQLQHNLKRALRHGQYLSVILADVDALKGINDAYGHSAGDAVLIAFVRHMESQIRTDIDVICRWGEDEFLLILPETTIQGAGRVAERLRKTMGELQIDIGNKLINASAGFGVSGFSPEDKYRNCTNDSLLLIVRRCLLQAKAAGGDAVLCCP